MAAGRSSESKRVNAVLKRHLADREEKARRQVRKNQAEARIAREKVRLAKAKKQQAEAAKKKAKAEKAALDKKFDGLPKTFSAKDCGGKGGEGFRVRVRCLERLKLRSPPLSFEHEARWQSVRDTFCQKYKRAKKLEGDVDIGAVFISDINKVLSQLVEHYQGASKFNASGQTGGDAGAFNSFFHFMDTCLPKPATTAVL